MSTDSPRSGHFLEGRHAVVTGGGRGIGRACALSLADAGAGVTVVARSLDELERVVVEVAARGVPAYAEVADVRDPIAVARVIEAARVQGDLHICVNAAGLNRPGPTTVMSLEDWNLVIDTNLNATFLMCRAAGAALLERGRGGRIINVSSQMGVVGYPGRAAYCASKHAVNGLTKALAVEWAKDGITVNAVAPTFIRTAMTDGMFADETFKEDVMRRIPIGRLGELPEVAAAVVFLASPQSALITGHVLETDGGWTAW